MEYNKIYNLIYSKISDIKTNIKESINIIKEKCIKRQRDICANDILYTLGRVYGSNKSYAIINAELKADNILNVSESSLTSRVNIDNNILNIINDRIITQFYCTFNEERRFIAVDGSYFYCPKSFTDDGFKLSQNKECCKFVVSGLYDVNNKIPINYTINKNNNERDALISQLKYFKKGDVLICDRGYYSEKLMEKLVKNNIDVIFRLKSNYKLLQIFKKNKMNDITINVTYGKKSIKFRLIKYEINKTKYYLGTTLLDKNKFSHEYLSKIYHERWAIESHFKQLKYDTSLDFMNNKSLNTIILSLYACQFIFILNSYMENIMAEFKANDKKINSKNSLNITSSKILYNMIYNKSLKDTINKIINLLIIVVGTTTKIVNNRKYKRMRHKPRQKWDVSGTTSNRPS